MSEIPTTRNPMFSEREEEELASLYNQYFELLNSTGVGRDKNNIAQKRKECYEQFAVICTSPSGMSSSLSPASSEEESKSPPKGLQGPSAAPGPSRGIAPKTLFSIDSLMEKKMVQSTKSSTSPSSVPEFDRPHVLRPDPTFPLFNPPGFHLGCGPSIFPNHTNGQGRNLAAAAMAMAMGLQPALMPALRWPPNPLLQQFMANRVMASTFPTPSSQSITSSVPLPAPVSTTASTSTSERRTVSTAKVAPIKKYKCDVCGKAFSRSNTLITHKRIHTGEKPFKCEHCGRAFRQPGNLTRHRLTHTTVKPYICSQCGKAFNRASNLHTHMRTHSAYRPFLCPFCAKGFHQRIDMKVHMYTHTDLDIVVAAEEEAANEAQNQLGPKDKQDITEFYDT